MPESTRSRTAPGLAAASAPVGGWLSLIACGSSSAKGCDCSFAAEARRYTRPRNEEHRHPDLRTRLEHGGDRAPLRAGTLAGAGGRGAEQPCRRRRPGLRALARRRDGGRRSQGVRVARGLRRSPGDGHRGVRARRRRARRLHARPHARLRAAFRRPAGQHPSFPAAALSRPAHPRTGDRRRLQSGWRDGPFRHWRSRSRADHRPGRGARAIQRHRERAGCARVGARARALSAGDPLARRRDARAPRRPSRARRRRIAAASAAVSGRARRNSPRR